MATPDARALNDASQTTQATDNAEAVLTDLDARLASAERTLREVVERENQRRDDAREAAERAAEAQEQAAAVRQQVTTQQPATAPDREPTRAPQATPPSRGSGTYTGCRAYGGNYAMTSVDDKGRPYAKIDCTTKAQIG